MTGSGLRSRLKGTAAILCVGTAGLLPGVARAQVVPGLDVSLLGNAAASATGAGATALGSGTLAAQDGSVALGSGSVADRPALRGSVEAFSGSPVNSAVGALSIGAVGAERQITNVAGGTVATDAVNLRQLSAVGGDLATALGGGAGFNAATGAFTAPSYTVGNAAYATVAAALAASNALGVGYAAGAGGAPLPSVDLTRGGALAPVALTGLAVATQADAAVRLSQLPLQYATATLPTVANPTALTNDVTLVGANAAAAVHLHDVANGVIGLTSTDAINGSQLYATNQAVIDLQTGQAGLVRQNLATRAITVGAATDGTSVDFTNGAGAARTLAGVAPGQVVAGSTQAVNGGQVYGLASSVAADLGGGAAVAANGTVTAPSYTVAGATFNSVGGAVAALNASGIRYDVDPATGRVTNAVTLAGGDPNQPVVIHNVAAGQARTDAANTGQVADARRAAEAYTDARVASLSSDLGGVNDRLTRLQGEVDQTRREARQGAAVGLAAASLRFDDRPGKFSLAAGGGYWRGEGAAAFGAGYTLPNGAVRLNVTAATTGTAAGVGGGATFTLN